MQIENQITTECDLNKTTEIDVLQTKDNSFINIHSKNEVSVSETNEMDDQKMIDDNPEIYCDDKKSTDKSFVDVSEQNDYSIAGNQINIEEEAINNDADSKHEQTANNLKMNDSNVLSKSIGFLFENFRNFKILFIFRSYC